MATLPLANEPARTTSLSRRSFFKFGLAAASVAGLERAITPPLLAAAPPATAEFADPVYHFLNRISYGVRSSDLAHARSIGVSAYLEEQLSPRMIAKGERVPVAGVLHLARKSIYRRYPKNWYDVGYKGLITGMITRASKSPAQLYERVVEFWSDHFNIAAQDLVPEVVDWQRTVIRRYALTSFPALLQASARHVAMLYYLDNIYSDQEHPNENYARELMELHTLGVGSGYTESDVKEIARVFTGWTADYQEYGGFVYDSDRHDQGDKMVLGHPIVGRSGEEGMQEGVEVLDLLAHDVRTRKFVIKKLCIRFISDAFSKPDASQQAVIDQLAAVWLQTSGDIKSVLRALFSTTAFAESALQKLRRPLDFFVAGVRATGTIFRNFWDLEYQTELLDQVPYGWGPPNGYPDVAAAWASTSGVLSRWAVAQTLTSDALPGNWSSLATHFHVPLRAAKTVGSLLDLLAQRFLGVALPAEAKATLIEFATDGTGTADTPITPDFNDDKLGPLAGLVLSLPQFQWR